jgi:hypothetical protein
VKHINVTPERLPALGDVRSCGTGERIWVATVMRKRDDWPRYSEAIMAAFSRGASVRWSTGDN